MTVFCVGDLTAHPLGQDIGVTGTRHNDQKFLAAPATDQVLFADYGLEDGGYFDQHLITHGMPPTVIDMLEVIDIDQQDRKFALDPLRPGKFLLKEYLGCAPVWDARQDIDGGNLHQVVTQALTHHQDESH